MDTWFTSTLEPAGLTGTFIAGDVFAHELGHAEDYTQFPDLFLYLSGTTGKLTRPPTLSAATRMQTVLTALLFGGVFALGGVCPNVTLQGRSVTGLVIFEAKAKRIPVPGARIDLLNKAGAVVAETTAAETGLFRINAPGQGTFTFKASAAGFHSIEGQLIATEGHNIVVKHVTIILGSDAILACGGSRILAGH